MQVNEIKSFFKQYVHNYDHKQELDDSLFEIHDREKWVDSLKRRSGEIRQMYKDNMAAIDSIEAYLASLDSVEDMEEEIAIALYDGIMQLYYEDCDDIYVISMIANAILPYFTKKKDFNRLINLHSVCYYQKAEIIDRLSQNVSTDSLIAELSAILGYKLFYKTLSIEARKKIFSAYYNICIVSVDTKKIDIDTSYYYLKELQEFYKSPMVVELDSENEDIRDVVERIPREWLGYSEEIQAASQTVKNYYMELSDYYYKKEQEMGKSDAQITYEIYLSHILTKCMRGQISYEEGFKKLTDYYLKRRVYLTETHKEESKRLYEMPQDDLDYLYYFINQPMAMISWVSEHKIAKEDFMPYLKMYLEDLHRVWGELYRSLPTAFLDQFVIKICVSIIKYLEDEDEKMEWFNKLLVKRDITTYIHSTMVSRLALLIAKEILNKEPQILAPAFGYEVADLISNKEEILKYIENSAYYHDLGKTLIGEVINTQTRKINNLEFDIIKRHPERGLEITNQIELLQQYNDVVIGHHKTYDGLGGYPREFDNTASKVKPIIDLITICDCIDAATDILGRNYVKGKDASVVIAEIVAGAGSRYNPDMASFIDQNEVLKEEIKALTLEGRMDCYYRIYEEYISK